MEAVICRNGSGSIRVQTPPLPTSPRLSVSLPRSSLPVEVSRRNIRRCSSETDIIRSDSRALKKLGSRSFTTPRIQEEEEDLVVADRKGKSWKELGFPGGGMNKNGNYGGRGGGGYGEDRSDHCQIGDYYKEMLKSDPSNSLLLRNYAKYLHEVERDMVKAEEFYGRAILASPGDGEVLSLYGKLIWETQRDEIRAKSYFHQALQASPKDCMVLGSYAHFLWEAEDQQQEEEEEEDHGIDRSESEQIISKPAAVVEAF